MASSVSCRGRGGGRPTDERAKCVPEPSGHCTLMAFGQILSNIVSSTDDQWYNWPDFISAGRSVAPSLPRYCLYHGLVFCHMRGNHRSTTWNPMVGVAMCTPARLSLLGIIFHRTRAKALGTDRRGITTPDHSHCRIRTIISGGPAWVVWQCVHAHGR